MFSWWYVTQHLPEYPHVHLSNKFDREEKCEETYLLSSFRFYLSTIKEICMYYIIRIWYSSFLPQPFSYLQGWENTGEIPHTNFTSVKN